MSRIDNLNLARYTQNVKNYIDRATDAVEDRIKLLIDQPAITATFTITEADTEINLHNLTVSYIDWGDNTTNSELTHTYTSAGIYTCKIYSVTSIGSSAFRDCDSLTSVVIGDSVTSIGNRAFAYCSSLTSIEIPDSVIDIGKGAFGDCTSLMEMTIPFVGNSRDALDYKAVFGYIFGYETSESIDPIEDTTCQYWDEDSTHYHYYIPASLKKVTVTGGTIGNKAFYNCSGLTSVNIGDNVTSIGQEAFAFCSGLTSIVIPNSVKTIGALAIRNCDNLTSVEVIGSGDTSIGEGAFWYCENLTNVVIGDGVTSIGNAAFHACANLVEMTIPFVGATKNGTSNTHFGYILGATSFSEHAAITPVSLKKIVITGGTIGNSAFRECSNLTDIEISDNVTSIKADAFMGCSSLTSITIGNSVTSIGDHAFDGCGSLTEIVIPDSVTSIGDNAFRDCSKLTSVTIGGSVTSISTGAFAYCSSLTSIAIPDSVTSIANAAFFECTSLTSVIIPDSVTSIGEYAFAYCSNLTAIVIPDSVTSTGDSPFEGCNNLTIYCVAESKPDGWTSSGRPVVWGYKHKEYPEIVVDTEITKYELAGQFITAIFNITEPRTTIELRNLTASCIDWGDGVGGSEVTHTYKTIGEYTCKIYGITSISNCAFQGCGVLTSVTIGDSVTEIGESAFEECTNLTSVVIGNGVATIFRSAFYGCTNLTNIVIPNNVKSIGTSAFQSCNSLTEMTVPFIGASKNASGHEAVFGYIFGYTVSDSEDLFGDIPTVCQYDDGSTYYHYYIPESLKKVTVTDGTIGNYAFGGCSSLRSVVLGDSVTSIDNSAFASCTSLTSVKIGGSVTSIGDYAFWYCTSLTSVVIPDSVTSIGGYAFSDCDSLTSVEIGSGVIILSAGMFSYCSSLTSIEIPGSVTSIGEEAFKQCSSLTSVVIPASVTSIGDYAFCNCDSLTSVVIPASIETISHSMFNGCSSLTSIVIPDSVTSIEDYAFNDCSSLTEIVIPNSVGSIDSFAFGACSSLTNVVIPGSVTTIGGWAFAGCSSLTEITIPFVGNTKNGISNSYFGYIFGASDSADNKDYVPTSLKKVTVTDGTIGSSAFENCRSLISVVIGDGVTSIGDGAFAYCGSLTSVVIGSGVTSIGDGAFIRCDSLTSAKIPAGVMSIGNNAFAYCDNLTSVVIPDSVTEMSEQAFYECPSLTIYCVRYNPNGSLPSNWAETWNYDDRPVVWGYVPYTATAAENIYGDLYTENLHVSNNAVELGLVDSFDTVGLIKNGSNVTSVSGYTACPIVGGIPYYYGGTPDSGGGSGSGVESTQTGESETVYILGATSVNSASSPTKTALNITATGSKLTAGSFYALSDLRLKENITEFKPQNSILELPIVEFDFKKSGEHQIGCIAQDLQKICPEIVEQGSDGFLKIQESKIVYLLLDEVKKLRAELEQLKEGKN